MNARATALDRGTGDGGGPRNRFCCQSKGGNENGVDRHEED